jgi:hypothetical protein
MIDTDLSHGVAITRERRREHARRQAECDWAELIEVVTSLGNAARAELANGTDANDPKMVELARQWRALIDHFTTE